MVAISDDEPGKTDPQSNITNTSAKEVTRDQALASFWSDESLNDLVLEGKDMFVAAATTTGGCVSGQCRTDGLGT